MRLLIVCLAIASAAALDLRGQRDLCSTVECRAGRECVVNHGVATCQCIQTCPDHFAPVCGSDGTSYDTHCLLHRHACLTGEHIKISHKGFCKNNKPVKKIKPVEKEEPAVCYSSQRDAFILVAGRHWQDTQDNQPWHVSGMTYRESLWGRFFTCDGDRDNYLDTDELLNCTSGASFMARPQQDQELTRALCVDALIDVADTNRDWRLDFEEFTTVFSPGYHPPQKMCSLENKKYLDGEDVHVDGNHCICAVGSWVCTSPEATKDDSKKKLGSPDTDFINYDENEIYDDDYNDLVDDEYDLTDDDDDDYLLDEEEEEDEEYLEDLFDDLLDKLRKHRRQQHHHNQL